jgi:tetratricopeptide (TPR) repeat protein
VEREIGGTENAVAYEAHLRGQYLRNQGEREATLREALAAYDRAIANDPRYARAHAARAAALFRLATNGYDPFDSGFAASREAALHTVQLAPGLGQAYVPLAFISQTVDNDVAKARVYFDKALALGSNDASVQIAYANFASSLGLIDSALTAATRATELDPISPQAHLIEGQANYFGRRWTEAEAAVRRALALDPGRPGSLGFLSLVLGEQRRLDEARAAAAAEPNPWQRVTFVAIIDAKAGRVADARRGLADAQRKFGDSAAYQYAEIFAQLGRRDDAFRWLETARRLHDPGLSAVLTDPLVDPLRGDPRFDRLLSDLSLEDLRGH